MTIADIHSNLVLTALNTVSEGLLIVDRDFRIIYANLVAKNLFFNDLDKYFPRDDLLKTISFFDLKNNRELDPIEMPISRSLAGLEYTDLQLRFEDKGKNRSFILSWNGTPLKNNENTIVGAVVSFRDITEKYFHEKRIEQERSFFKNILDLIPAAIFVRNGVSEYLFTNKTYEEFRRMFEKGNEWEKVHKELAEKFIEHTDEVKRSFQAKEYDEYITMPDGQIKEFKTIRFPILDEKNKEVLICGIAFDITESNLMKKNFEEERLKSINSMKLASIGTLAGEIGHEINNPLTVIKSITYLLIELLEEGNLPKEFLREKLVAIDLTLERVNKIIRALKNLSRKAQSEEKELCNLEKIFEDVLSLCELRFKKKGIKFKFEVSEKILKSPVKCHIVQMSEVFVNLISNALDAIELSVTPWIRITGHEDEKNIYLTILDSGSGVAPELKDKVFEPFFTTKEVGKGTGLGLSIAKNILASHGGDVSLSEIEGKNFFRVQLPKELLS